MAGFSTPEAALLTRKSSWPILLTDQREHLLNIVIVGDIGLDHQAAGALAFDQGGGLLGVAPMADIIDHHIDAVFGEPQGNGLADPPGAAGHQCDFAM